MGSQTTTLSSVQEAQDVWVWIAYGLLPHIFDEPYEADNSIEIGLRRLARWNQVLGIRLSQLRAQKTPCGLTPELQKWYGKDCHTITFGYAEDWLSDAMTAAGEDTPPKGPEFKSTQFIPGYPRFLSDVDVQQDLASAVKAISKLSDTGWVDSFTSTFTVEIPFVSAEVGFMGAVYLNFVFQRGGAVEVENVA